MGGDGGVSESDMGGDGRVSYSDMGGMVGSLTVTWVGWSGH